MATFYLDFEGGNDSNDGTTFANRWKTITSGATAARTAPGDVIRIMKSPDPVSLGVNGTFTNKSPTITLASAVTANISLCQAAWTASANVTTNTNTARKEGTLSTAITPAAAFTTGLLAYEATGTLDLSAYQNVTFWIRTSTPVSANVLRLDLCSDAAGATPVHSITIDTAFSSGIWKPVTWKNGSALSSSIQSVALTALSDPGTPTILIDNILATNDLHFNAVIGTSSSATSLVWYPIRSINGTTVTVGVSLADAPPYNSRGWHDTTTTTTVYVRSCITLSVQQTVQESGTATSRYVYSGGWDRTSMSTQDGLTFVISDGNNTNPIGGNSRTYITYQRFGYIYFSPNFLASGADHNQYFDILIAGNNFGGTPGTHSYFENLYRISCDASFNVGNYGWYFKNYNVYSTTSNGLDVQVSCFFDGLTALNNATHGVIITAETYIKNLVSKDNASAGLRLINAGKVDGLVTSGNAQAVQFFCFARLHNVTISEATKFVSNNGGGLYVSRYSTYNSLYVNQFGDLQGDVSSPVHGSATRSLSHTISANTTTYNPNVQPLQPFAVAASSLVTFKIWVYRTSTNVEGRVRLRGYVTPGVDADVTATITAAINTWQELTVTCTPSAAGVVQIDLESYSVNGSTGTVYFGDATVSQA